MRRRSLITSGAFFVLVGSGPAWAVDGTELLKSLNHDSDQTLELPEALAAATKLFGDLNTDGDLTLEKTETAGRLTDADWRRFNKDKDQTLELDEWLAIVRERFNAADTGKDGKLTAQQLGSPAGQSLAKLLVK